MSGRRAPAPTPGPACYGAGGTLPTVTDASLVLGYIGTDRFAGGTLRLDIEAARAAIAPLAQGLGLSIEDAAAGIHRVLNAAMTDEIRRISLHRGEDPRRYALVLLGGGGPVHGAELGRDLGITDLVVPRVPGLLAAYGLLTAPVTREQAQPFRATLTEALHPVLLEAGTALDAQGRAALGPDACFGLTAHMRYAGQSHELEVALPELQSPGAIATLRARFEAMHSRFYGRANPGRDIEITGIMATHTLPAPPLPAASPLPADSA